jgi:hypothetical protein
LLEWCFLFILQKYLKKALNADFLVFCHGFPFYKYCC